MRKIHIPVLLQIDVPAAWDTTNLVEAIDVMRLKDPNTQIKIKSIPYDDLNIFADIAYNLLRNVHQLGSEIKEMMANMLSEAIITKAKYDKVGVDFKIPERTGRKGFFIII